MNDPEKCEHDFRRLYMSDLNPQRQIPAEADEVVAVVCCGCGKSPLYTLTGAEHRGINIQGDWPETHKLSAYYFDQVEGPSVEFTIREEDDGGEKAVGRGDRPGRGSPA